MTFMQPLAFGEVTGNFTSIAFTYFGLQFWGTSATLSQYIIIIIIIITIIIIIKTCSTGSSGKNKVVYKLLSQPHKQIGHGKLKKTHLREAPAVDCTLEPIQRSGIKHSVGKVIPHSNLGRQETPCKSVSSTP